MSIEMQKADRKRGWTKLTGNRTIYAIRVEHIATRNTVFKALSYESRAALCKSGGNETTSFADSRILRIV